MNLHQAHRIADHIASKTARLHAQTLAKPEHQRTDWLRFWHQERRRLRYWTRHICGPFFARPLPERLHSVKCSAKTRSGLCTNAPISQRNGRCSTHGGLSTGPCSAEGKAQALANLGEYALGL